MLSSERASTASTIGGEVARNRVAVVAAAGLVCLVSWHQGWPGVITVAAGIAAWCALVVALADRRVVDSEGDGTAWAFDRAANIGVWLTTGRGWFRSGERADPPAAPLAAHTVWFGVSYLAGTQTTATLDLPHPAHYYAAAGIAALGYVALLTLVAAHHWSRRLQDGDNHAAVAADPMVEVRAEFVRRCLVAGMGADTRGSCPIPEVLTMVTRPWGEVWTVRLPEGVTIATFAAHIAAFGTATPGCIGVTEPVRAKGADMRTATFTCRTADELAAVKTRTWPGLDAEIGVLNPAGRWEFGVGPDSDRFEWGPWQSSLGVFGGQGSGKSTFLRTVIGSAVLSGAWDVIGCDYKDGAEFDLLRGLLYRFSDDPTELPAILDWVETQREVNTRWMRIHRVDKIRIGSDGHRLDPAMSDDELRSTPTLRGTMLVIDEVSFAALGSQERIERLMRRARAAGICVVWATQRLTEKSGMLPGLKDLTQVKVGFNTGSTAASDYGHGPGAAKQGFDSSTLDIGVHVVSGDGISVGVRRRADDVTASQLLEFVDRHAGNIPKPDGGCDAGHGRDMGAHHGRTGMGAHPEPLVDGHIMGVGSMGAHVPPIPAFPPPAPTCVPAPDAVTRIPSGTVVWDVIRVHGPIRAGTVAARTGLSATTVKGAVRALHAAGIIAQTEERGPWAIVDVG